MPTFEIPDGPTTVELERSGNAQNPGPATGSVVFSVTNRSGASCDGSLDVVVSNATRKEWFTLDGGGERTFAPGETQTATIRISAPKDVAEGSYPFFLRAVAGGDTDNDWADGPTSIAKVPPAPVPGGKPKWWLWILIGVLVLVVIAAVIYFAFLRGSSESTETVNMTGNTATPLTPASRMGTLEMGFDRPGLDIRAGQTVPNVQACVKQCEDTQQCVALTYVFPSPGQTQNGVCWIKSGIPHQVPNPYMISAVKVPG